MSNSTPTSPEPLSPSWTPGEGRIRFQRPALPSSRAIERYLERSRRSRWFTNFGPCWELLRDRLGEAVGRTAVPVANATLGLMLALAVLGEARPERDEVLMPSFAFPADAQAAVWNRLRPVFVEVGSDHWHLDPAALRKALAERRGRTAAVVALSAFGAPPSGYVRREWEAACAEAGVPLVVDSAAGFGARADDGVPLGRQGDAEIVSFDALKPLAAGEGGAVFFRDDGAAAEACRLSHFSFDEAHRVTRRDGLNAMMSELAAAAALAAMDDLGASLDSRRNAAVRILEQLPPGFTRQEDDLRGTWQFIPLAAPDGDARDRVLAAAAGSVELRTYYEPLHLMAPFARSEHASDLGWTERLGARMLNLPMAPDLSDAEIAAIAAVVQPVGSKAVA